MDITDWINGLDERLAAMRLRLADIAQRHALVTRRRIDSLDALSHGPCDASGDIRGRVHELERRRVPGTNAQSPPAQETAPVRSDVT